MPWPDNGQTATWEQKNGAVIAFAFLLLKNIEKNKSKLYHDFKPQVPSGKGGYEYSEK